jgi:Peptidase family M1 domain
VTPFFRGAAGSALALATAAAAFGATPPKPTPAPDPTYAALRAARPSGEGLGVRNWTLERDAFRFHFGSGTFQLLPEVAGRIVGAVFAGEGSFELRPATESERRRLAFQTKDEKLEVLTDTFETAVFLFTDSTGEEIRAHGEPAPATPRAAEAYEKFWKRQRKDLKNNLQVRVLRDLLEGRPSSAGFFLAVFDGKKLPPAFAIVDPVGLGGWFSSEAGPENVTLYVLHEEKGGYWYLSRPVSEIASGRLPIRERRARAESYAIETTIARNTRLRGTTEIRFLSRVEGLRVLNLGLMEKLRVESAEYARGDGAFAPAGFVQEDEDEDADLSVVFPEGLPADRPLRLRLTYEGKDVLQDAGDGNFVVGARESWYPNLGSFTDPSAFDLAFRCPKAYQIVSVGEMVEDRIDGDERVSLWRSERPIRVAGFNYGKFKKLTRTDSESGMTIEVYTNPGEPDFLRQLNFLLENRVDPGLHHISANPESLADSALADGINTARVGSIYFGPLPESAVSITQQTQAFFGQSWPTLIYLPYIAAFDGTIRHELGLSNAGDFVDSVGPHEFAHQWWGHRVGWASYRDQWLSEGFAEFTAGLVAQFTGGLSKGDAFWEKARRWILWKPRFAGVSNDEAGPITDGWRLSTWRNRAAAQAMIYSKGAFVLHMLRMAMRDPEAEEPDARFIAMMKDFVETSADGNPTTRDFQEAVERHMTPELDAAGNGKMDWFFRQWVEGTEIPRFEAKLQVDRDGDDRYRIHGSVAQSEVSPEFRSVVPIYVVTKGEVRRIGRVRLQGNASAPVEITASLPVPPDKALANALHDVLSRD